LVKVFQDLMFYIDDSIIVLSIFLYDIMGLEFNFW